MSVRIEDLLPGVRIEVAPPPGACKTCGGAGKIATRRVIAGSAALEIFGREPNRSIRLVPQTRTCPHCWGNGRELGR